METPPPTPKTYDSNFCIVCGRENIYVRVQGSAGQTHNLRALLLKYGCIDILQGGLCRPCLRLVKSLDSQLADFKNRCNSTLAEKHQRLSASNKSTPSSKRLSPQEHSEHHQNSMGNVRKNTNPTSSTQTTPVSSVTPVTIHTPPSASSSSPALVPQHLGSAAQCTPTARKLKKRLAPRVLSESHGYSFGAVQKSIDAFQLGCSASPSPPDVTPVTPASTTPASSCNTPLAGKLPCLASGRTQLSINAKRGLAESHDNSSGAVQNSTSFISIQPATSPCTPAALSGSSVSHIPPAPTSTTPTAYCSILTPTLSAPSTPSQESDTQSSTTETKKNKRPVPCAKPDQHDYASDTIKRRKKHVRNQEPPKTLKQLMSKVKDSPVSDGDYLSLFCALQTRSLGILAQAIANTTALKLHLVEALADDIKSSSADMNSRKRRDVSYLMEKDISSLEEFSWGKVIEEACIRHPSLITLMASCLVNAGKEEKISQHLPRLGMAYAILVQGRNDKLSLVQRLTSIVLYDNLADQKIYDRLQPLGVTLSYTAFNNLIKVVGGHYDDQLVDAILKNKRFRIIGDNINWKTGVGEERIDHHAHMEHAFGSIAIIQNLDFSGHSEVKPQIPYYQVPVEAFLPNHDDWESLKNEYMILIGHVLVKHLPWFGFLNNTLPKRILGPESESLSQKNDVVPLPVLYKNEQDYDQVADILDFYEDLLKKVHAKAGKPLDGKKFHIGGDQLTLERFYHCLLLALGLWNEPERWSHLGPITFELFHLIMNFLMLMFKNLYDEDSANEVGTMRSAQYRITRNNVSSDVRKAYDADKDFMLSYVDMHIVEAALQHFEFDCVFGHPKHILPPEPGKEGDWAKEHLGALITKFVAPEMENLLQKWQYGEVVVDGRMLNLRLRNGGRLPLMLPPVAQGAPQGQNLDQVKNYAHRVLDLGLLFKSLLDLVHLPDRSRGLRLLKYVMLHFRENSHLSKYAYEIMRFLVHQQCTLSEKEAYEEFYGLFVNTTGKVDGHVACDDRMEWAVHDNKKHVKHMASNKTAAHVELRTSALAGVKLVSQKFDDTTDPIVRSQKHSVASALRDEAIILEDLRTVRPFQNQPGRRHPSFVCRSPSPLTKTDVPELKTWTSEKKYLYGAELVQ